MAVGIAPECIDREIGALKADIGKLLAEISDRLADESARFSEYPNGRAKQGARDSRVIRH